MAGLIAFEDQFIARLEGPIRRILLDRDDVSEIKQRLRVRIPVGPPPAILSYSGRGPLIAWLRAAAVREAIRARAETHQKDHHEVEDLLTPMANDPEFDHFRALYNHELKRAFAGAFATLETRERNLLRHVVLDGLRVDEVAKLHGIHRVTASKWLSKARQKLLVRTRKALSEEFSTSGEQLDSIIRCVDSRLDLSLERLLGDS